MLCLIFVVGIKRFELSSLALEASFLPIRDMPKCTQTGLNRCSPAYQTGALPLRHECNSGL